ncbi:Maltose/galactoside acetyltransferase [Penicillium concentricum]|uniref:Maltose/galactoside acetyltransferase n=1 Tax=Penicillium concentricum TaxID=293559 RepID=A0A9W9UYU0_9EURO|nr:Maltose/galactoside acetyltransferase [Penicillium concentricum]KAJ5359876.1 Maltose/galactoside acetyltransferase [Penicillium concentricum]
MMTALAAPVNGHDSGAETGTEHSPSRFTAVNGRDPVISGNGNGHGPTTSSIPNGERAPAQEKNLDSSRRDDRNDPASDQKWSQRSSPSSSKNKRKRSESRERDSPNPEVVDASRSPNHPESNQANPNGSMQGSGSEMERGNHSATPSHRSEGNDAGQTSANSPWSEYDSQLITQAQRAQQMDASDAHLADALQREAGQERSMTNRSTPGTQQPSSPSYAPERHGTMQVAPKRKRVFSNRTKTGCMTCRRRKKKCDEQHPACNNCLRGGFLCEGYSSRSTWQKPSSTKTPIPLQSKEGYSDINGPYMQEAPRHQERQPSLVEHVDATKIRPLAEETDRPVQQYNTSPTHTPSNHTWSKQTWPSATPVPGPTTGHPSYPSEPMAKVVDYREVPPIHELSREGRSKPDYPVISSIRDLSHPSHPKSNMPLFQNGPEQRTLPAATVDTHSPQAQARMALTIEHQLSGRTVSSDETEKEKMIRGKLYRPFDVHLVEERDRCRGALWKFNNACNPLTGISSKEQNRLLKEVIVPPAGSIINSPGTSVPRSAGSIGQGAVVEAPFSCHYGYNIHIGEDVMISENCLFVDDCVIRIGAHTWIGPNVKIISSTAHPNMQERKGSQSRYQGRQVIIEEDCYVGAGCIIYPGVRLARGVYVAPGEIVNANIAGYMFQGSKPSFAM